MNTRFFSSSVTGTLWGRVAAGALASVASVGSQAALVTVSDVATISGLFTGASASDGANPGDVVVDIGLSNFKADVSGGPDSDSAFDTISFTLTAADGFFITGLSYKEDVAASVSNGGVAIATGSFTYNGIPLNLGVVNLFSPSGTTSSTGTLGVNNAVFQTPLTSVDIVITNSLFAATFGPDSAASISKSLASLTVTTAAVPVPAAAWLFGSALVGLVTIGRRGSM
jgi:hypothetical protein